MMDMRFQVIALVVPLIAQPAVAEDYSDDDLSRAVGDTPKVAVQPRDRLFFEKHCACVPEFGCAEAGSPRWKALQERYSASQARHEEERKAERQRKATAERKAKDKRFAREAARRAKEREEAARAEALASRRDAERRDQEGCEKYLACVAEFSAAECNLVREQMEKACLDRGGAWGDCTFERAKLIATKKSCDPAAPDQPERP